MKNPFHRFPCTRRAWHASGMTWRARRRSDARFAPLHARIELGATEKPPGMEVFQRFPGAFMLSRRWVFFSALASLSIVIKGWLSTLGYNFDLESFDLVANLAVSGKNAYLETKRFNYGPLWIETLKALKTFEINVLGTNSISNLHLLVALLLSVVDVLIALVLWKAFNLFVPACLFLLNPVSLLITGYHSQFDNVAILLGICAIVLYRRGSDATVVAILLGSSLATKHLLLFLPLWFAMRGDRRDTAILLVAPYIIFAASFIPYLDRPEALPTIIQNVFLYKPIHTFTGFFPQFVDLFVPLDFLRSTFSWVPFFGRMFAPWPILMIFLGYYFRSKPIHEWVGLYLIALCALSPFLANQYLAIPLFGCVVLYRSRWTWVFLGLATLWLLGSEENVGALEVLAPFHLIALETGLRRTHVVAFLFCLLVHQVWAQYQHTRKKGSQNA